MLLVHRRFRVLLRCLLWRLLDACKVQHPYLQDASYELTRIMQLALSLGTLSWSSLGASAAVFHGRHVADTVCDTQVAQDRRVEAAVAMSPRWSRLSLRARGSSKDGSMRWDSANFTAVFHLGESVTVACTSCTLSMAPPAPHLQKQAPWNPNRLSSAGTLRVDCPFAGSLQASAPLRARLAKIDEWPFSFLARIETKTRLAACTHAARARTERKALAACCLLC